MRDTFRAGVRVLLVLGLVLVSAITVQARGERAERELYPAPGQMLDIGGGQQIHVRTWGSRQHTSDPAIVLDISASMPVNAWAWVGQGLAERGHFVVAYDRPGMGWSTGPWQPRDAGRAADALARALNAAAIEPPYVVVAHSFGGFSARVFAGGHRHDVTGLVLLDTTHPDGGGEIGFATWYRLQAWRAHVGMFHLVPSGNMFPTLPEAEQMPASAVSRWTSHLDTTAEELEAWHTSAPLVRAADLEGLPLLVAAANGGEAHQAQQRDMLNLSAQSQFVQIEADHMAMLVQEGPAQMVIEQVDRFLADLPWLTPHS